MITSADILMSTPWFLDQESWFGIDNTIYWVWIEGIGSLLENLILTLQNIATWVVLNLTLQKATLTFYRAICFRIVGKMVRTSNSMIMGPLAQSFGWEVSCLIRGNDVWNAVMTDEASYESTDGNFGSSIACREVKFVCRVNVYSNKNKTLLFPWWKWSNVINLPPITGWLP